MLPSLGYKTIDCSKFVKLALMPDFILVYMPVVAVYSNA